MQAGDYPHRIVIEQPTESRSASGAQSFTWATFTSRWARFVPKGSREYIAAQAAVTELEWLIECPGFSAITTKMRVNFSSRFMDILAAWSPDGKAPANASTIFLACKEGPVKAGT